MKKIWCALCALFCAYSVNNLLQEKYEVTYLLEDRASQIRFSCCIELNNFYPNETEIDLTRLRGELYDFLNHIERPRKEDDHELANKTHQDQFFDRSKAFALDLTKSGNYHIHNYLVCWLAKTSRFNDLLYLQRFLGSKATFFELDEETLDSARMDDYTDNYNQLVVLRREQPYSDCVQSHSKFHCLHGCFKRSFRLARYFYDANETGRIQLNTSRNRSIEESVEHRLCSSE